MMPWNLERSERGWRLPIEQRAFGILGRGRVYRHNPACPEELGPAVGLFGHFSDGSSVSISLRSEERVVQETAVHSDVQTKGWASW